MAGSGEAEERRRRVADILARCLDRAKLSEPIPPNTLRRLIDLELHGSGDGTVIELEPLWRQLCKRPGTDPKALAPALLTLKSLEEDLEVELRLPAQLATLPLSERARLRAELPLGREQLLQLGEPDPAAPADPARRASTPPREASRPTSPSGSRRPQALALLAVAVIALVAVCYATFRQRATAFDVSDVAALVQLTEARRQEQTLVARIADPRWASLPREERRRRAAELFARQRPKGIQVMTLLDANDEVQVLAIALSDAPPELTLR